MLYIESTCLHNPSSIFLVVLNLRWIWETCVWFERYIWSIYVEDQNLHVVHEYIDLVIRLKIKLIWFRKLNLVCDWIKPSLVESSSIIRFHLVRYIQSVIKFRRFLLLVSFSFVKNQTKLSRKRNLRDRSIVLFDFQQKWMKLEIK